MVLKIINRFLVFEAADNRVQGDLNDFANIVADDLGMAVHRVVE